MQSEYQHIVNRVQKKSSNTIFMYRVEHIIINPYITRNQRVNWPSVLSPIKS